MAIFALILTAGACVLATSDDVDAATSEIRGDTNVVKISGSLEYELIFFESEAFSTLEIKYTASLLTSSGGSTSGSVSPASGTLSNGVASTIVVRAPDTPGKYTLHVSFTERIDNGSEIKSEKSVVVSVVEPIVLKSTLTNNSNVDFSDFAVYFYVDNELISDSRTLVSVKSGENTAVTYDWVTDSISGGTHTFKIVAGSENIGEYTDVIFGSEHSFYVGGSDFGIVNIIMILAIILLIIMVIYISRKQVKNYGKPKARR